MWLVASRVPATGDLACNPGMYPDWESNQRPFGSQASTQSTEPHQPGQTMFILITGLSPAVLQSQEASLYTLLWKFKPNELTH